MYIMYESIYYLRFLHQFFTPETKFVSQLQGLWETKSYLLQFIVPLYTLCGDSPALRELSERNQYQ